MPRLAILALFAALLAATAAGCGNGSDVSWSGVPPYQSPTPTGTATGGGTPTPTPGATPTPLPSQATECSGPMISGVDVSDSQGTVDWNAAAGAGIRFAWIKATQGDSYVASTFAANWAGAKAAGIHRGAYHFFDPTVDGVAQANELLSAIGTPQPGDLPPAIDIECPNGSADCLGYSGGSGSEPANVVAQRIGDLVNTVHAAIGRAPVVYTFPYYFSDLNIDATALESAGLWVANWQVDCPMIPAPWYAARFWQSADNANIAGIGPVDYDVFFGTEEELAQWAASP